MVSKETDSIGRMLGGRCECRAVRYVVPDAFLYSANCHCSNCRASTGAAFKPFAGIEREKLVILEGADTLLVWGDDEANHTRCGICGSLLYWSSATASTCTSRWARSSTTRRFARVNTSSWPRRLPGSTSPTSCRRPPNTERRTEVTLLFSRSPPVSPCRPRADTSDEAPGLTASTPQSCPSTAPDVGCRTSCPAVYGR